MNDYDINYTDIEPSRLAAVRRYDVLDTPPDGAFDRITAIAARRFNVPIALVSIVDADRIFLKSHHGLPIDQIGRDDGLCATTILSAYPRVLTDAKTDNCAMANPLVSGDFGLRFYAGAPLTTYDGYHLGTLCVVDTAPRAVTQHEVDELADLATVVMDQLELRRSARTAIAREQLLAKEIDHRVMNSLQFISSLLEMQSMAPEIKDAARELQLAANRVAAIAQVHRHFYANAESKTSCISLMRRLSADMAGILGRPITVTGDEGEIATTLIQPVGLIANELITNAAKHGAGPIGVAFRLDEHGGSLSVSSGGPALPAGFKAERSGGLGMRVVATLLRQLHGSLTATPLDDGTGARFTASFPI
jgi:two-component sensor histidine kinase